MPLPLTSVGQEWFVPINYGMATLASHHSSAPRSTKLALAGWIALSLAAGSVGAYASRTATVFYAQLDKAAWAPPGWLFGPVWTTLYILMGIAAWLVWRERGWSGARTALTLFVVQLVFNALWTYLFFSLRSGALAFGEILVLWVLIAATIALFGRVSRTAALLLVPYLCWVSFASALTWSVWQRNPALL